MPSSRSTPERRCSSPTRTHPGSGPPTRTPMVFWVSIFRREPTSLDGLQKNSKRSLTQSTTGHVKSLVGKPPPKSLQSNYTRFNNPVLHRPIELTQFRSRKFVLALGRHGMVGSMGRVGAAGDNAAMESFFSLLQKNVLNRRRWTTRDELRIAIVTWIERTYHRRRRQAALGRLTPVEFEIIMTAPATQAA